jgi:cation diffusion facilitator family transporter
MQVGTYLKLSVAVALATIALKAAAWWVSGSVSLLSDAVEGLVNLAGATFALAMVTIAARPPDDEHPYGHHKAEYFSSGFEGVLILVAAAAIVWEAVHRLLEPQAVEQIGLGLGLAVLASLLNAGLAFAMLKKAREARSVALEADARHLFTDVATTAGVVIGLLAVAATGWHWLDPLIAIAVALNIVREGVKLLRRSIDGLMDHALDAETQARIESVLAGFDGSSLRFDHVVTRRAGSRRFVELHMHLNGQMPLRRAAEERLAVERALMAAVPGLRASIQLLPIDAESQAVRADAEPSR